jgi:hypothetical protein
MRLQVLDKGSIQSAEDEDSTLKARRLLVKLSEASDTLPSSLFIQGVARVDQEATFGGTFGDIYRASYQGEDVALKRIRVFQRDATRHKIRQVGCSPRFEFGHFLTCLSSDFVEKHCCGSGLSTPSFYLLPESTRRVSRHFCAWCRRGCGPEPF